MQKTSLSPNRLILLMAVSIGALLIVPRPYSTVLMGAMLVISIAVLMRQVAWQRYFDTSTQWLAGYRMWLLPLSTVVALVAFGVSIYALRTEMTGAPIDDGARAFLVGGMALGVALLVVNGTTLPHPLVPSPYDGEGEKTVSTPLAKQTSLRESEKQVVKAITDVPARVGTRWRELLAGVGLLALLSAINGRVYIGSIPIFNTLHFQFLIWIGGVVLVARGLIGREASAHVPLRQWLKLDWVLVAILLLALGLRLYDLEGIHRFVDEVHWFDAVPRVWSQPENNLLMPFSGTTAFTWVYPYVQAWVVEFFGRSFTSIRLLSVVMGTAGVFALYLLAKALFNRNIALMAALFLAAFPPHIQFSRIALNNIADPLFGTLALACLAMAMCDEQARKNVSSRTLYVLGGVCLGLTQYFYEGGRLLYPPLVFGWLIGALILRELFRRQGQHETTAKAILSVRWQHVGLFTLAFIILAFPIYFTLARQQLSLTPRLEQMGFDANYWRGVLLISPVTFLERLPLPALMYVQRAETGWFYGGKTALLLWFMVPLFYLGWWHSFWRLRYPGTLLVILWLLATIFGNSLMQTIWWSARYVVSFPAVALALALGVHYTLALLARLLPRKNAVPDTGSCRTTLMQGTGRVLLNMLLIGLAVAQIVYFFTLHLPVYNYQFRFGRDPFDAIFRAVQLPAGTHVILISDVGIWRYDIDVILAYWERQSEITVDVLTSEMVTPELIESLPVARTYAFFIAPDQWQVLELVRDTFTLDAPVFSPFSVPLEHQFLMYYAPPGGRE